MFFFYMFSPSFLLLCHVGCWAVVFFCTMSFSIISWPLIFFAVLFVERIEFDWSESKYVEVNVLSSTVIAFVILSGNIFQIIT